MYQQGCVSVESRGRGEGNPHVLEFECPNILYVIGMVTYSLLHSFSHGREVFCIKGARNRPLGSSVSGRPRYAQGGISSHSDLGFLMTFTCEKNS